jgi:hypothetical protein
VIDTARSLFERVLVEPTAGDLWELQKTLLEVGGAPALRARIVAREFHGCLRSLESKSSSRSASRWGAALGAAAVGSVSLPELLRQQDLALEQVIASALPALLEVGSSVRSAQAWEVEAQLLFDDFAWFLYEELSAVSTDTLPDLPREERRARIDQVVDPLLDPTIPESDRAWLLVEVFRSVLAARLAPVLG